MRCIMLFFAIVFWLGLASTVASAWYFAAVWQEPAGNANNAFRSPQDLEPANGWIVTKSYDTGSLRLMLMPADSDDDAGVTADVPTWSHANEPPASFTNVTGDRSRYPVVLEDARGWPFHSLRSTWVVDGESFVVAQDCVQAGVPIAAIGNPAAGGGGGNPGMFPTPRRVNNDLRAIPFQPIWPGFLTSSLVWAGAWAVVLMLCALPSRAIHRWQRRVGRCVRCRYIVRHTEASVCTECGWPVGRRTHLLSRLCLGTGMFFALAVPGAAVALAAWGASQFEDVHPLQEAARLNDVERINALLAAGHTPDQFAQDSPPWPLRSAEHVATPLMWATAHGQLEAMQALIDGGANLEAQVTAGGNIRSNFGMSTTNQDDVTRTPLTVAVAHGQTEAFALLIRAGAAPSHEQYVSHPPPIHIAARSASPEMVRLVLSHIENPAHDRFFNTALREAAAAGNRDTARALLDAGADVDGRWTDEHDTDVNPIRTPLLAAVEMGAHAMASFLIDAGASVADAQAPLVHAAVVRGDVKMIKLLLAAGADPNHTSGVGFSHRWSANRATPLVTALRMDNLDIARLLVDGGASLNTSYEGNDATILFRVRLVERGRADEWVRFLVRQGGDVNHQNTFGNTALIDAIGWDRDDIVRALFEAGADLSIRNQWNRTALDVAESLRAHDAPRREENPALTAILQLLREARDDPAGQT